MRGLRFFALVLISMLMVAPASAERRVALVIGNSNYADTTRLANPINDADLMARTLESAGFEVTKLTDADQSAMKRAMLEFGRELRDGVEASLFYYAGHGVQARGINYLIPVDAAIADEAELDFQAIDVNAFLRVMETSSSRINIVVLDACRNNPYESRFRSTSRGLAMVDAPRGTYIAYSTSPGQVAEDGSSGNSPYTTALAEAIAQPGLKIEDTFKEARATVLDLTAERQVPWETSSITGDFFFRPQASPPIPTAKVAPAAQPAFSADTTAALAWSAIQNSTRAGDFAAFIAAFGTSNPFLAGLAQSRLDDLAERQVAALPPTRTETAPAATAARGPGVLVPQIGHSDWIRGVAWSPDGRRIASAADDQTVRVWDVASGRVVRILAGHEGWVRDVAWSPDGNWIASASQDGKTIIWRADTGTRSLTLESAKSGVLTVAWSPSGDRIATGGYGGVAEIWDGSTGRLLETLAGHSDWIRRLAWSPDGRFVATASDDHTTRIWNASGGKLIRTLEGHEDYVKSVAWSPDGARIVTGSDDHTVKIWNASSGALVQTLDGYEDDIQSVAWSPDGRILATSDRSLTAKLYDGTSYRLLRSLGEESDIVQVVAWSRDGRVLATGGSARTVTLWTPETGAKQTTMTAAGTGIGGLSVGPDGERMATFVRDVDIIDLGRGAVTAHMRIGENIQAVAWSPDGEKVAVGGSDRQVRVFDSRSGAKRLDIDGHEDWIRAIAWSPDGRRLVSGGDDNVAIVWDAGTGAKLGTLEGHTDWIRTLAWSPDGKTIASGADDKEVRLWNAADGKLKRTIKVESRARQLAFSPDSRRLLMANAESTMKVWATSDGSLLHELQSNTGSINAAAVSDDGELVAAGAGIWDRDGRLLGTLDTRSERVQAIGWSPSHNAIVTLLSGGAIEIWRANGYRHVMTAFVVGDDGVAVLYPDGTSFAPGNAADVFAVVVDDEVMPSIAGYENLFRSAYTAP